MKGLQLNPRSLKLYCTNKVKTNFFGIRESSSVAAKVAPKLLQAAGSRARWTF